MQGWAAVFAVAAGVLVGLAAAPEAKEGELSRCLRECGNSSGTDAETCRLQCRQQAEGSGSGIHQWQRTELKGGSPDPNVERGSTTTETTRGPNGTTTTVTKVDGRGKTTVTRVAGGSPASASGVRDVAWCYVGCSTRSTFGERATCRTKCPRVKTDVVRETAPTPTVGCADACASRGQRCHASCPAANSDRATCALQCDEGERACRKKC